MLQTNKVLDNWLEQVKQTWQNPPDFNFDKNKLKHLAIICDGNRRAAKEMNLNPYLGHRVGAEVVMGMARACRNWGIKTITFWVWSTENWRREKKQVEFIMNLARKYLSEESLLKELIEDKAKFVHLGRRDRLPNGLKEMLDNLENTTKDFTDYTFNLALDYGGIDEMQRAVGKMAIDNASPEKIFEYLDTADQPLPDLVIRPGISDGELMHTSGFMPLQTAYSSWIALPDLFPNLTPQTLLDTLTTFLSYEKRQGK